MAQVVTYFNVGHRKYVRFEEKFASKAFLTHVWDTTASPLKETDTDGHAIRIPFRIHEGQIEFPILERVRAIQRGRAIKLRPGEVVEGGEIERQTGKWFSWTELHRMYSTAVKPPPNLEEFLNTTTSQAKQPLPDHLSRPSNQTKSTVTISTPPRAKSTFLLPHSSPSNSKSISKMEDLLARLKGIRESSPGPENTTEVSDVNVELTSRPDNKSVEISKPAPPTLGMKPLCPAFVPTSAPRRPATPPQNSNSPLLSPKSPNSPRSPTAKARQPPSSPLLSLTHPHTLLSTPTISQPGSPSDTIPQKRSLTLTEEPLNDSLSVQLSSQRTKVRKRGQRRDSTASSQIVVITPTVQDVPLQSNLSFHSKTPSKAILNGPKRSNSITSSASQSTASTFEEKHEGWRESSASVETEATSMDEHDTEKLSSSPISSSYDMALEPVDPSTIPITFEDFKNFLPPELDLDPSPTPTPRRTSLTRKKSTLKVSPKAFDWAQEVELFSDEEDELPSLDDWLRSSPRRSSTLLISEPEQLPMTKLVTQALPTVKLPKARRKEQQRRRIALGGVGGTLFKRLMKGSGVMKMVEERKMDEDVRTKEELTQPLETVRVRLGRKR